MAIDEQYLRIRRSLEEKLGVEEAFYLMDRPVGGWSELVTNHTLDLKFAVLDERFNVIDARFEALDARFESVRHELKAEMERGFRRQAWALMSVMVVGFTAVLTAVITQGSGT